LGGCIQNAHFGGQMEFKTCTVGDTSHSGVLGAQGESIP
jgi:hypothetical protein